LLVEKPAPHLVGAWSPPSAGDPHVGRVLILRRRNSVALPSFLCGTLSLGATLVSYFYSPRFVICPPQLGFQPALVYLKNIYTSFPMCVPVRPFFSLPPGVRREAPVCGLARSFCFRPVVGGFSVGTLACCVRFPFCGFRPTLPLGPPPLRPNLQAYDPTTDGVSASLLTLATGAVACYDHPLFSNFFFFLPSPNEFWQTTRGVFFFLGGRTRLFFLVLRSLSFRATSLF